MRLIDADKMLAELLMINERSNIFAAPYARRIKRFIDRQPTIEERKHGHWKLTEDTISCPFCDYWNLRKKEQRNGVYVYSKTPNYCPNCGAEMESTK